MNRQSRRKQEKELNKQLKNMKTNKQTLKINEKLQFEAIPVWDSNSTFTINGVTLEYLARMADTYRPLVQFVDAVIMQGKIDNKILTQYLYEDGSPAPETDPRIAADKKQNDEYVNMWREKLEERKRALSEQLENLKQTQKDMESYSDSILNAEGEPLNKESKIVNIDGEVLSSK
jgi:spore germination protein YaaH